MSNKAHINELTYTAFKDMAGVLWSFFILMLFILPSTQAYRWVILFALVVIALLPFGWVLMRKVGLGEEQPFSLSRNYPTIIMDFLWKYTIFGIGMFLIRAISEPNLVLNPQSEFKLIILIIHAVTAIVLLVMMKILSKKERSSDVQ